MSHKKRLFEIYNRINNLQLNEDAFDQFESEQMIELKEDIVADIERYFEIESNDKMFRHGIPTEFNIRIQNENVEFNLKDDNGFKLKDSIPEKNEYDAIYIGDLGLINDELERVGVKAELTIPIIVELEKQKRNNEINFNVKIWVTTDEVKINFISE